MRQEENQDPYTPPPRYKQRSGTLVRVGILAALLGAAAWGYVQYSQQPQTALVEPVQEQVADAGYNGGYQVDPVTPPSATPDAPAAPADTSTQPGEPASSEPAPSDPPA